jgi:hypothetical protein
MSNFDHSKLHKIFLAAATALVLAAGSHGVAVSVTRVDLERAREDLAISQATEQRIAAELEQFRESGAASPQVLEDYESYLGRVRAILAENQRLVVELEAAYAKLGPSGAASSSGEAPTGEEANEWILPEEEEVDELAALHREFNDSLAAFDEMLLKELARIRARSTHKMRDLAGEAAAAAKRLRDGGVDLNTSLPDEAPDAEGESANGEGEAGEASQGPTEQQEGAVSSAETASGSEAGGVVDESGAGIANAESGQRGPQAGGEGGSQTTERKARPDGHDDDIVARQIREAAEEETDPELKEKLWKEYEDYKRGSGE